VPSLRDFRIAAIVASSVSIDESTWRKLSVECEDKNDGLQRRRYHGAWVETNLSFTSPATPKPDPEKGGILADRVAGHVISLVNVILNECDLAASVRHEIEGLTFVSLRGARLIAGDPSSRSRCRKRQTVFRWAGTCSRGRRRRVAGAGCGALLGSIRLRSDVKRKRLFGVAENLRVGAAQFRNEINRFCRLLYENRNACWRAGMFAERAGRVLWGPG
jgi:hypothetical protein